MKFWEMNSVRTEGASRTLPYSLRKVSKAFLRKALFYIRLLSSWPFPGEEGLILRKLWHSLDLINQGVSYTLHNSCYLMDTGKSLFSSFNLSSSLQVVSLGKTQDSGSKVRGPTVFSNPPHGQRTLNKTDTLSHLLLFCVFILNSAKP